MNTTAWIFLVAFVLAAFPMQAETTGTVQVNWVQPENFKDAYDSDNKSERSRKAVLANLEEYLKTRTARRLPEGYTLVLNVSQLDLEGEFEPMRGAMASDVRIVKDIYPARIELSYILQDPTGETVSSGEEKLSSFGDFPPLDSDMTRFAYTKDLFDSFVKKLVREVKK